VNLLVTAGAAARAPHTILGGSVTVETPETPVLDTLTDIVAVSADHNTLSPRDFMLARIAALIAVDAPPASYLANADAAEKTGVTADDIQGIMIAVAPVVGTPRVVSAGGKILRALGLAIAVEDAALEAAADDDD
jgi:alkylhydroperoxidase/carboxymuconolactone decarboxylase family protein YurZ